MPWEDPDILLKKKFGREEYIQRMLTSLVLGSKYPRWNTRKLPSTIGESFLRDLHIQTYGNELEGPLEFVDELELLSEDGKDANGAPDYAVFSPSRLWIIELKTEAGSHRKDQLPLYVRLTHSLYPEANVSIMYLTGPMAKIEYQFEGVPYRHLYWIDIASLIDSHWRHSSYNEERLLADAVLREIQGLDCPARAFQKDAAVVRDSLSAAVHVQSTGEQAGIEFSPGGLQELHDLQVRIRDALAREEETENVRPWIWSVATSGGSALTELGSEVGYEIRLSRYKRSLS